MENVMNMSGVSVNFEAALALMDDEILEQLTNIGVFDTEQEFFTAYERAHQAKYGDEWELSKANPVY